MPLYVNETVVSADQLRSLKKFVESFQDLKTEAGEFSQQDVRPIGPKGLVYVDQREYAVVSPEDDCISIVGSEDATTCHIIIIRHTGSGVVCLAHVDNHRDISEDIKKLVDDVKILSTGKTGKFIVHMVGGFTDDKKYSVRISQTLLKTFHAMKDRFYLKTACITDLNNTVKESVNWPIIYGVGFDVKKGAIFPATFPDKGPDMPLRGARHFTGTSELLKVYDSRNKQLCIGPFDYEPFDHAHYFIQQSDAFIRQNMSTSPEVEPAHFVERVRMTMKQFIEHPNPLPTVFKNNMSRRYKKCQNGSWELMM